METVFGVYLELAELEGSTGALRGWHRYLALNYRGPVHPSPMAVAPNEIVFELEFGDGLNLKPVRKQQQTTQNAKTFSGLLGFHGFFHSYWFCISLNVFNVLHVSNRTNSGFYVRCRNEGSIPKCFFIFVSILLMFYFALENKDS